MKLILYNKSFRWFSFIKTKLNLNSAIQKKKKTLQAIKGKQGKKRKQDKQGKQGKHGKQGKQGNQDKKRVNKESFWIRTRVISK